MSFRCCEFVDLRSGVWFFEYLFFSLKWDKMYVRFAGLSDIERGLCLFFLSVGVCRLFWD